MKYIVYSAFLLICYISHAQHFSKSLPIQLQGVRDGGFEQFLDLSGIEANDFIAVSFYLEGAKIGPASVSARFISEKNIREVLHFAEDSGQDGRFVSELIYLKPEEAGSCKLQLFLDNGISGADIRGDIRIFVPQLVASENRHLVKKGSPRHFLCPCPQPDYIPRRTWGSGFGLNENIFIGPPVYTKVTHLIVHHSAGTNVSNNWAGVVAAIFDFHVNTNKWSDVGYNWLIDPNGVIYEGRGGGDNVRGAHMCGYNNNSMAACLLGNFEVAQPTDAMVTALTKLFSWKACKENISPEGSSAIVSHTGQMQHISGHKDGCSPNYTQCPGQNLYVKLPSLRTSATKYINETCSTVSDVQNVALSKFISISPNPATDQIHIDQPEDIFQINILNLTGSLIFSTSDIAKTIDISALSPGTYTVMLLHKSGPVLGKFIKI